MLGTGAVITNTVDPYEEIIILFHHTIPRMTGRGQQFIVPKNLPYPCPAGCGRCFQTEQGQNHHISSAKSCAWYKKGKLAEVTAHEEDLDNLDNLEPGDVLGDLHQEMFQLVPAQLGKYT